MIRLEAVESGELNSVSTDKLKTALRRIRDKPTCGKALGDELKGCRSVRVGGSENRIVYRVMKEKGEAVCEVLAVERRKDGLVYDLATKRFVRE